MGIITLTTDLGYKDSYLASIKGKIYSENPNINIVEIDENRKFEEFYLKIQSCLVPHAEPFLKCLAFRFDYKGKSFVFSGDAGLCDEL